jgi:hypothetical protein
MDAAADAVQSGVVNPQVEIRATEGELGLVLVELVVSDVNAWAVFTPSGDDLYAVLHVFSDRRGGRERIDAAACRVDAEFMRDRIAELVPRVTLDLAACETVDRKVLRVGRGPIAQPTWLRFERRGGETYPVMATESGVTELWMWRLVPLPAGAPPVEGAPPGHKLDAVYYGSELPIVLP